LGGYGNSFDGYPDGYAGHGSGHHN
jgi:hypothetical protein